jgi:uridine kinase
MLQESKATFKRGQTVNRLQMLEAIAQRIAQIKRPHPLRVAIDGVDAAGKTTLADELVAPLQTHGLPVIWASIDNFHNPARLRHRRGAISPEGYYHDSFNYQALITLLLAPLGPGGSRRYCPTFFDYRTESETRLPRQLAPDNAILLFDGVFLLRPELDDYWDFSIFVHTDFAEIIRRAEQRDVALFGHLAEMRERYDRRYIPGQKLYLDACRPQEQADLVVDNNNPSQPLLYQGQPRRKVTG